MMLEKHLLEQIDACRSDADLNEDELAELRERAAEDGEIARALADVQALDERIGEAFADVAVPVGLAERIQARLSEAAAATGEAAAATGGAVKDAGDRFEVRRDGRSDPAQGTAAFGAWKVVSVLAAAACVLIAVGGIWLLTKPPQPPSLEALRAAAQRCHAEALESRSWQNLAAAPESRPISRLLRISPAGWRSASCVADADAVVYDLTHRGIEATLHVVRPEALPSDVDSLPSDSLFSTGGQTVGIWRERDLLYVLVVSGDRSDFRRLVDQPRIT